MRGDALGAVRDEAILRAHNYFHILRPHDHLWSAALCHCHRPGGMTTNLYNCDPLSDA
jgi:hypothetical protein